MGGVQLVLRALRIAAREALPDQAEQLLQTVVEVVAVAGLVGGERGLFQLAQVLDAVALQVGLGVDGRVAQFGPGLDVEQEQQPVHVAQAFQGELVGQVGVVALVDFSLSTWRL